MAREALHIVRGDAGTARRGVSPGASAGNLAGLLAGRRADPLAYRRVFRDRWGAFLRANFHNPLHVAVFFSVDESTARKWWNDVNEPQGWVVAVAVATHPKALPMLLEDAA